MNQYDPNQPTQGDYPTPYQPGYEQPYPPAYQEAGPGQPPYAPPPSWLDQVQAQLGSLNVGIIAAGTLFVMLCLVGACVVLVGVLRTEPAPPRFPTPLPTNIVVVNTPQFIVTPLPSGPTVNPGAIGSPVNPYVAARLDAMNQLFIDVLNPQTGQFERKAQILGADLNSYREAFNVTNFVQAADFNCPDRVRLTAARADGSIVTMSACLKGAVVLRSADIPELGGGDLPMYPLFIDLLAPYLPFEYRQLLGIS